MPDKNALGKQYCHDFQCALDEYQCADSQYQLEDWETQVGQWVKTREDQWQQWGVSVCHELEKDIGWRQEMWTREGVDGKEKLYLNVEVGLEHWY